MKLVFLLVALSVAFCAGKWTTAQFDGWRKVFIYKNVHFGMTAAENATDADEDAANEYIMSMSQTIEEDKKADPEKFKYESMYFGNAREEIEKSDEFEVVKDMPKGPAFDTELFGLGSVETLLGFILKRKDLYIVTATEDSDLYKIGDFTGFHYNFPEGVTTQPANFIQITTIDKAHADYGKLLALITVKVEEDACGTQDLDVNWKKFQAIKENIKYLTTHHEIFDDYVEASVKELAADGVDYVELRCSFEPLHGLPDKKTVSSEDVAKRILRISRNLRSYLTAMRIVYVIPRDDLDPVKKFKDMQKILGIALVGFDFGGRTSEKTSLRNLNHELNEISDFYKCLTLTAGNSLEAGTVEAEDVNEAVLLGAEKINGGVAILNYPYAMQVAREKGIIFVIDPIKYQFLGYGKSMKNHPINAMMAAGLNVVIGGGAPGMFGGKGVSHNYYYAMKATGSKEGGIKKLKKLVSRGLVHNRMTVDERTKSIDKHNKRWKFQCKYLSTKKIRFHG